MAEKYNLPDSYKGDTFESIQFTITVNSVALDLTGATIACKFRKDSKQGVLTKSITSSSGITISAPATGGIFVIDAFDLDWAAGVYYYDIEITDAASVITTYVYGTITIKQDVTYG